MLSFEWDSVDLGISFEWDYAGCRVELGLSFRIQSLGLSFQWD